MIAADYLTVVIEAEDGSLFELRSDGLSPWGKVGSPQVQPNPNCQDTPRGIATPPEPLSQVIDWSYCGVHAGFARYGIAPDGAIWRWATPEGDAIDLFMPWLVPVMIVALLLATLFVVGIARTYESR